MADRRQEQGAPDAAPAGGCGDRHLGELDDPGASGDQGEATRRSKEQILWIERFDTLEQLRTRIRQLARKFNEHWLLERHRYPSQALVATPGLDGASDVGD